jgi:hypothetical protein
MKAWLAEAGIMVLIAAIVISTVILPFALLVLVIELIAKHL